MRSLTCIVCPIGCDLKVEEGKDGELIVSGNRCPRGAAYAVEEIRSPKRVVTATCRLDLSGNGAETPKGESATQAFRNRMRRHGIYDPRRLPVKTSVPCPKERIDELLKDIYTLKVKLPVQEGSVLLSNWKGTGIDVVAVRALD
jgi:CxxC motif-containing protein